MTLRTGIYIVPTHRWYIERTVWLIAGGRAPREHGTRRLGRSALGADGRRYGPGLDQRGAHRLLPGGQRALPPRLHPDARGERQRHVLSNADGSLVSRAPDLPGGRHQFVASPRRSRSLHSAWWLLFTGFVGGAMVWFAATGFCIMANGLYWLGAEPRLAPEAGSNIRSGDLVIS